LIRQAEIDFREDDEWLGRLAEFDGYLTVSDSVRRTLASVGFGKAAEPLVAFFELTPDRQFVISQIEKLIGSGAFRLCSIAATGAAQSDPLQPSLATRPYVRCYGTEESDPREFEV